MIQVATHFPSFSSLIKILLAQTLSLLASSFGLMCLIRVLIAGVEKNTTYALSSFGRLAKSDLNRLSLRLCLLLIPYLSVLRARRRLGA